MLKHKIDVRMTCPRHRRYNPAIDRMAGVKGNCSICLRLLELCSDLQAMDLRIARVREEMKAARR
jgi:hypothetical protein